jgi:hypothetical protein
MTSLARPAIQETGEMFAREVAEETLEDVGESFVRTAVDDVAETAPHLNSNTAQGDFAIYNVKIGNTLHKIGKADANRITKSSGLPTRIHQQVRKLQQQNPNSIVRAKVVRTVRNTTTQEAKRVETSYLQRVYK